MVILTKLVRILYAKDTLYHYPVDIIFNASHDVMPRCGSKLEVKEICTTILTNDFRKTESCGVITRIHIYSSIVSNVFSNHNASDDAMMVTVTDLSNI